MGWEVEFTILLLYWKMTMTGKHWRNRLLPLSRRWRSRLARSLLFDMMIGVDDVVGRRAGAGGVLLVISPSKFQMDTPNRPYGPNHVLSQRVSHMPRPLV